MHTDVGEFWELGLSLDEIEWEELGDFSAKPTKNHNMSGAPACPLISGNFGSREYIPLWHWEERERGDSGRASFNKLTRLGCSMAVDGTTEPHRGLKLKSEDCLESITAHWSMFCRACAVYSTVLLHWTLIDCPLRHSNAERIRRQSGFGHRTTI